MINRRKAPWGLILLIVTSFGVMIPLCFVDYDWTMLVFQHRLEAFGEIMRRTLFEGDAPGAGDPAILFQLVSAIAYFSISTKTLNRKLLRLRPFLGFVVFSSFVTGLGLVHSFKWVIGRARPDLVLNGTYPFTHWFEFGPHFVSDGIFYGSFPSGHTATVFLLMTVSYGLMYAPSGLKRFKVLGVAWGGIVIAYSALMILGRSMTLHHWLTDSIGIVFMAWISLHVTFFYVLKVPQQLTAIEVNGRYTIRPRFWELSLLWRLVLITVGVMCMIIGYRSILLEKSTWLVFLSIPGICFVYIYAKSLIKAHKVILTDLALNQF